MRGQGILNSPMNPGFLVNTIHNYLGKNFSKQTINSFNQQLQGRTKFVPIKGFLGEESCSFGQPRSAKSVKAYPA